MTIVRPAKDRSFTLGQMSPVTRHQSNAPTGHLPPPPWLRPGGGVGVNDPLSAWRNPNVGHQTIAIKQYFY